MPELILQISDHLIVNITQFQNWRDVKVVYEWINDGVRSTIINHTVEDDDLCANLWDTRWTGTMWDMRKVQAVIDSGMRGAFDVHWRQMLKGMGKREIIALANHGGVDNHFTLNPNGGMDSWLVKDGYAYHAMYYQTIDDIITGMWAVFPKIDGWVKVAKGDIYPSLDDDDTQELERVGENDETVPGEAVEAVDTNSLDKFEVFAVPRLSKMKDLLSLVLVGDLGDGHELQVWFDGRKWHSRHKYQDNETNLHLTYDYMVGAVIAMYKACPSMDKWKMRQLTMNGFFDTIFTQEWNKADGAE